MGFWMDLKVIPRVEDWFWKSSQRLIDWFQKVLIMVDFLLQETSGRPFGSTLKGLMMDFEKKTKC